MIALLRAILEWLTIPFPHFDDEDSIP